MKNKLSDLNDHLFQAIEYLSDRDITGEKLTEEINRAKTICDVAEKVIFNGKLVLEAAKTVSEWPDVGKSLNQKLL
jgi:hypothetical protein